MEKKIVHYNGNVITIDENISKEYINLVNRIAKLEKELKPIQEQLERELKETMEKLDTKEMSSNGIVAKMKAGYTRESLDTTRLKNERTDIYNEYLKATEVASKVNISLIG